MRYLAPCLLALAITGTAFADRTVMTRTGDVRSYGARGNIAQQHYGNGNGFDAFGGVWQGTAPIIVQRPDVGQRQDLTQRPVFNLIYYQSIQSQNANHTGAIQRAPNNLRPGKGRP